MTTPRGWNSQVFSGSRQAQRKQHAAGSWWATDTVQHDRQAFDAALDQQMPRLQHSPRYAGWCVRVNVITAADECGLRAERRQVWA